MLRALFALQGAPNPHPDQGVDAKLFAVIFGLALLTALIGHMFQVRGLVIIGIGLVMLVTLVIPLIYALGA